MNCFLGSLTDSICTAYEHPPVNSTRRLPSQGSVVDKLIEETSADISPDNKKTNSVIEQSLPSVGKNYDLILKGRSSAINENISCMLI